MDVVTYALAVSAAKKILPAVTSADAGEALIVGNDGKWTTGEPTTSMISVSDNTLVITTAE